MFFFFFLCCTQDVSANDVLRGRLPARRRATARGRLGGETHIGTPVPAAVTFEAVCGLVRPATGRRVQTGSQPVAAHSGVRKFAQEESATVVGVQQPKIDDHYGPRTNCVHARRAQREGKSAMGVITKCTKANRN